LDNKFFIAKTVDVLPIFDFEILNYEFKFGKIISEGGKDMDDYEFGNRLYELRVKSGLTQSELAKMLGVTNKAVSKWETGKAKPITDTLTKLATTFQIPFEELLLPGGGNKQMKIEKIVITGGPCAGKTTAMSWIQNAFTELGYHVIFVPETATELITGGIASWILTANAEYQIRYY